MEEGEGVRRRQWQRLERKMKPRKREKKRKMNMNRRQRQRSKERRRFKATTAKNPPQDVLAGVGIWEVVACRRGQ